MIIVLVEDIFTVISYGPSFHCFSDEEAEQKKKKKKTKTPVEGGFALAKSISAIEVVERVKKPNKTAKHIVSTVQLNGCHAVNENIRDPKEVSVF